MNEIKQECQFIFQECQLIFKECLTIPKAVVLLLFFISLLLSAFADDMMVVFIFDWIVILLHSVNYVQTRAYYFRSERKKRYSQNAAAFIMFTIMCFLVATYFIPLFVHSSVKIISINAGLSFIQSIFLLAIYHDYYTSQRQKKLIELERFDRDNFRNENWKVLLFSLFQGFISFILFVANACFVEDTMMFSFLWINIMRIVGIISAFYAYIHNGIYFLTCFYQPIYFLASVLGFISACFVFENSYTFSNYELAEANSALELLYIGIALIIDIMVYLGILLLISIVLAALSQEAKTLSIYAGSVVLLYGLLLLHKDIVWVSVLFYLTTASALTFSYFYTLLLEGIELSGIILNRPYTNYIHLLGLFHIQISPLNGFVFSFFFRISSVVSAVLSFPFLIANICLLENSLILCFLQCDVMRLIFILTIKHDDEAVISQIVKPVWTLSSVIGIIASILIFSDYVTTQNPSLAFANSVFECISGFASLSINAFYYVAQYNNSK